MSVTTGTVIRNETHTLDGVEYRFIVTYGLSANGTPLHRCRVQRADRQYGPDQREFDTYHPGPFETMVCAFRHLLASQTGQR